MDFCYCDLILIHCVTAATPNPQYYIKVVLDLTFGQLKCLNFLF